MTATKPPNYLDQNLDKNRPTAIFCRLFPNQRSENVTSNSPLVRPYERVFNIQELAILLGSRPSKTYDLVRRGVIQGVKFQGSLKITESELVRYLGTLRPATYKPAKAA